MLLTLKIDNALDNWKIFSVLSNSVETSYKNESGMETSNLNEVEIQITVHLAILSLLLPNNLRIQKNYTSIFPLYL